MPAGAIGLDSGDLSVKVGQELLAGDAPCGPAGSDVLVGLAFHLLPFWRPVTRLFRVDGLNAADRAPVAGQDDPIPVYDLVSLALIGVDELADAPESAQASIVDAVGVAIGVAIADAEDAAFAAGTGSGQPSGLALAANVTLVPAGQKVAVGTSNTPTTPG